jgi:hypothetical protein
VAAALLLGTAPATAIGKCKAKVDKKTGAILVSATDVANNPLWGEDASLVNNAFANTVDCFTNGKLKGCRLGAPGSLEEATPPVVCTVFLADDGPEACSARVPGCTVGIRPSVVGASTDWLLFAENLGEGGAVRAQVGADSNGSALNAYNYGTQRYAGEFEILNPASNNAAIYARTNGSGYAAQLEVNSDTSASALFARTTSNDPSSRAAVFSGGVSVQGNLTKSSGSFLIDHPLDPANKYLSHSFVESPDMMNVYNGNAVLGADGRAVVELPEWFEALNRDFRYQLTPIGGPGPELHVAEKIAGNRFAIAGGKPGLEVSWQVTGVRQDAYANAHRVAVETPKPAALVGTYIHPELFGAGPERQRDLVKR